MPVTLGMDTATADTAVAVTGAGEAIESATGPAADGRPLHTRALLGAIETAVSAAGGWPAIELIAVGVGPGSFTGLRIGISTARALAQARGLPLVGVPSTSALAAGIAAVPAARGRNRLAVIDARRGEIFVALDEGDGPGDPFVSAPEELAGKIGAERLAGALAAGDGSLRFASEIEALGVELLDRESPVHRLSARQVCILAAEANPGEIEAVRPMYLRRPDAERWLERDGRN
jgi:tRNA threonylcarbamoyladenosine biosynthesis protein TsaB